MYCKIKTKFATAAFCAWASLFRCRLRGCAAIFPILGAPAAAFFRTQRNAKMSSETRKSAFPIVTAMRDKCAKAFSASAESFLPEGRRMISPTQRANPRIPRSDSMRYCASCGHCFNLSSVDQDAFCCGRPAVPLAAALPKAVDVAAAKCAGEGDWVIV